MAIRQIITEGDDILRKVSKPVTSFDDKLYELLDDMKDTLEKSGGVGLSAVQVGVLKRVFVISLNNCYFEVINPKIVKSSGSQCGQEGCLSIPNRFEDITRPKFVTVDFVDRFGNKMSLSATDFMARAICHENDHLNGILYIDYLKKK